MKIKFNLVTSILFLLISVINAQNNYEYGIKIGISNSSIYQTEKTRNLFDERIKGHSLNPTIALFLNCNANEYLNFETEILYIQKGSRYTRQFNETTEFSPEVINTYDYTISTDIRYLELGINICPTIKIDNIPIYCKIGSSINFTLNAMDLNYNKLEKILGSYKIGLGTKLKGVVNMPVFIEINYSRDFTNFYSFDYGKLWNEVIVFNVGFIM